MNIAYGLGLAACVLLGRADPAPGPDPGSPFPTGVAVAYVYNNTDTDVRWMICSPIGVVGGGLSPGEYAQFSFVDNNAPRTLSVFDWSMSGGSVLSCREVELHPAHYYFARIDLPVAEPLPGQPKPVYSFKADKGFKEAPKGAKEAPPPKKLFKDRP